jgi:hypothetical protein
MQWHFRDQGVVATNRKIAALHIADYLPRFLLPLRSMNFI